VDGKSGKCRKRHRRFLATTQGAAHHLHFTRFSNSFGELRSYDIGLLRTNVIEPRIEGSIPPRSSAPVSHHV
jgi:hypothetical protein